ncbi:MAG: IscA/HesB family protein [Desulfarculaceae bacterium]|nr:IscA/HesB family protein [Desulfarculaceae bacterium]MCF8072466.1 IscA/HesB family protein [Desulfarculaceae bacterium]MCF8102927.1 IscA/HesB family protein [Desulfarculaceae bacterium]MCF8117470.1 IscA/HesB family protein [Desulfarculaceae bacterium]
MMEMTPEASQALKTVMAEKKLEPPIRIFMQSGCGGAQLALGVDEARDGDETFAVDGVDFVVQKELSEVVGDMKLDFVNQDGQQGFMLSSSKPLPQPDSCGTGGGCGDGCCGAC